MPPVRILVTGALGYLGQHLCRTLLHQNNIELHGVFRTTRSHSLPPQLTLHQVDLSDLPSTIRLIEQVQPQQSYHLAGNIHAGRGNDPSDVLAKRDNLVATQNLYDACLRLPNRPRIVFSSTGAIYGQADGVITESSPLNPLTPYAASKAAADSISMQYSEEKNLPIICARLFNYIGPGQDESTALSRFAHQLKRLEQEQAQPAILRVGNLNTERDFLDVADVIQALILLMERGRPGQAYNVASGISHPMHWYLARMLELVSISVEVQHDESMNRRAEAQKLQVDISKLQKQTGWQRVVPIQQTLSSMIAAVNSK